MIYFARQIDANLAQIILSQTTSHQNVIPVNYSIDKIIIAHIVQGFFSFKAATQRSVREPILTIWLGVPITHRSRACVNKPGKKSQT